MTRFSRVCIFALLFGFVVGCASDSGWRAAEVPYPTSTPYDSNPFARTAFLDGFERGYRAESTRSGASAEMISGPQAEARRRGFYAGAAQARVDKAK